MTDYIVYTKHGKQFSIRCEKFEPKAEQFIFYNSGEFVSTEGFLSINEVAAIVPEHQVHEVRSEPQFKPFIVHLRKADEPITVYANVFEKREDGTVKFSVRNFGSDPLVTLTDYYFALSEVVSIFPEGGLARERKRSISGFPS